MQSGVLFADLTPGFIGLCQIKVIVPTGLTPGFQSIYMGRFGERPLASAAILVK